MKIKFKQITASLLAFSLACTPLTTSAQETCTEDDVVCQYTKHLHELQNQATPENFLKRGWHWLFPTKEQKFIQKGLQVANKLQTQQRVAGFKFTAAEVHQAVYSAIQPKSSGWLNYLFSSLIANPFTLQVLIGYLLMFGGILFRQIVFAIKNAITRSLTVAETLSIYDATMSDIKGQPSAIEAMKKIALATVDNVRAQTNHGTTTVVALVGPSGCGKSEAAKRLARAISGDDSRTISMPATELFSDRGSAFGLMYSRGANGAETATLSPLLKKVATDRRGTIIIDEVDKMTPIHRAQFEEIMRVVIDNGGIYVPGYGHIDFSNYLIVLTSNESVQSYTKGNHENLQHVDDGTGSRTYVEHDKSYLNRIKFIEFNKLGVDDYKAILIALFKSLRERFERDYNVSLYGIDAMLDDLSQRIDDENQGARPARRHLDDCRSTLLEKVVINKQPDKHVKLLVFFNKATDQFVFVKIDDNGRIDFSLNTPEEKEFISTKLKQTLHQATAEAPAAQTATEETAAQTATEETAAQTAAEETAAQAAAEKTAAQAVAEETAAQTATVESTNQELSSAHGDNDNVA